MPAGTAGNVTPQVARLSIVEGRYHQVRRMFAAVGNHVESLHRISVGAPHPRRPGARASGVWPPPMISPPSKTDVQASGAIAAEPRRYPTSSR